MSWIDAKSRCEKDSAQLAIEDTAATHDFIKLTYRSKGMWIGATDSVTEGKWFWVDGQPLLASSLYWGHGDTGRAMKGNCLQTNIYGPGTWNDLNCLAKLTFLCQKGNTFISIQYDNNISLFSIPIFS